MAIEALLFIFIGSMLEYSQFDNAREHVVSYIIATIVMVTAGLAILLIPTHYFAYRDGVEIKTEYF